VDVQTSERAPATCSPIRSPPRSRLCSTVAGWGYVQSDSPAGVLFGHAASNDTNTTALLDRLRAIGNATFPADGGPYNGTTFFQPADDVAGTNLPLPPASLQSFLRKRPQGIAGVVITEFVDKFANPYYQSNFDQLAVLNDEMKGIICAAANLTAQAVWLSANPSKSVADMPPELNVSCDTVNTLLTCLLTNITCDLVEHYLTRTRLSGC